MPTTHVIIRFVSFTSDLSVAEFTLATGAGLRPLRLVGGAGVFRLPPPAPRSYSGSLRPGGNMLMTDLADRWNHARSTVLARLRDEAAACGADLVTGVSLRCRVPLTRPSPAEPASWYREFTATGTAMACAGVAEHGLPAGRPVLTHLRLQDYRKLTAQGTAPAGLVTATVVAAVRPASNYSLEYDSVSGVPSPAPAPSVPGPWVAGEMTEYHAVMRRAYSEVLGKLSDAAARLGAAEVTATEIERSRAEWSPAAEVEHTALFVHALGTAVSSARSAPPVPGPLTIVPVRQRSA